MTPAHSHSIKVPTNIRHSMTVKDQFQSLDFSEIVEPLKKKIQRCSSAPVGIQRELRHNMQH